MKIKQIELKNYKQFKDLTLDLTYPKGHKKEGQPLDKICIIGQSGTGKTNILNVIKEGKDTYSTHLIFKQESNNEKIYFSGVENKVFVDKEDIKFLDLMDGVEKKIKNFIIALIPSLIFFLSLSSKNETTLLEQFKSFSGLFTLFVFSGGVSLFLIDYFQNKKKNKYKIFQEYINSKKYIVLNESSWNLLKLKIDNYYQEKSDYKNKLSDKLLNSKNYEKKDFLNEMQEWEEKNKNILNEIVDKLNFIMIKFNLEVIKIDPNQKSYNDLTIKDLSNGNIIEYEHLSTGTKNLIATFIPLKIHNPKDSIILIDEPENSFYPDIQRKLTELYMEVGENNQLVFATHSPLIASSFEPWEVVELKFDKDNQIYREKYYEGDNHVDNYVLDPRMLTWTGILTDIFDLKEDSNFAFREKKLMEYATLKAEIKSMTDTQAKEEAFKKLQQIGKHLGLYNQK